MPRSEDASREPVAVARAFARCMRRYGSLGFDLARYREHVAARHCAVTKPRLDDLFVALGLLCGDERAFEVLRAGIERKVLRAARRVHPDPQTLEEEWQALLSQLPARCAAPRRSPLEGYQGSGSLAGFLGIVLSRRLLRARRRPRLLPLEETACGSALQGALSEERRRLATEIVARALRSLPVAEAELLQLHYLEGLPLTRASVRCGLLSENQRFLRTAASRCHRRAVRHLRDALLRVASSRSDVRAADVAEVLDLPAELARCLQARRRCS